MTREGLEQVKRENLIELALSVHAMAEREKARRIEAERQLAWFKRQLFGTKSEKRPGPIAEVSQLSLGETTLFERSPVEKTISVKAHARVIAEPTEPNTDTGTSQGAGSALCSRTYSFVTSSICRFINGASATRSTPSSCGTATISW